MNTSEFSRLLKARRVGKGKYVAHCPNHPDKNPSLAIAEGKKGIVICCMSAGCETKDILAAMGLTWGDLFYGKATPAVRVRTSEETLKVQLTEQWQSARLLGDLEPQKRNYWRAVQRNAYRELQLVRCRLEPVEVYREYRGRMWQGMSQRQRDKYLERIGDGIHTATVRARSCAA